MTTIYDYFNSFWLEGEKEPFSPTATALFFYLLYEANRNYWRMPIACNTCMLAFRLNVSRQAVYNARNTLRDRGFLHYESGDRSGTSARYTVTVPDSGEVSSDLSSLVSSLVSSEVSSEVQSRHLTEYNTYIENTSIPNTSILRQSEAQKREERSVDDLCDILSNDAEWLSYVAQAVNSPKIRSPDDVLDHLHAFFNEQKAQGIKAREEGDCRKHFYNWLKKSQKQQHQSDGLPIRTNTKRTGSEVSDCRPDEFEMPFNSPRR